MEMIVCIGEICVQLQQDSIYYSTQHNIRPSLIQQMLLSTYHVPGTVSNVLECQECSSEQVRHICPGGAPSLAAKSWRWKESQFPSPMMYQSSIATLILRNKQPPKASDIQQ